MLRELLGLNSVFLRFSLLLLLVQSKPITLEKSKHVLKDIPSMSKLVLKTSRPGAGNDEKRKQQHAQMREKAAASLKKQGDTVSQSKSSHTLAKMPAVQSITSHHEGKSQRKPQLLASVPKVSQDMTDYKEEIRSPMDTYEISDREESDSEYESDYEDESKPKKKVCSSKSNDPFKQLCQMSFHLPVGSVVSLH